MNNNKTQLSGRLSILVIALMALFLTGCGVSVGAENWAGLSAAGDTVYVAGGTYVTAINIADQRETWTFTPESGQTNFLAAPTVTDSGIILADYGESRGMFRPGVNTSVYMLDTGDGVLKWREQEVATDRIIASPLLADGRIFVGTAENTVIALDTNGNPQWQKETGHAVWGQPSYADGVLIVASLDRHIYAFDASTGNEIWKTEIDGAAPSKPIINGDLVYVGSFDSQIHALDIDSGDEVWTAEVDGWVWNSPVVADGNVYFGDAKGGVYAVDAASGSFVWRKQFDDAIEAGVVVDNGIVFAPVVQGVSTDDEQTGRIIALDANDGTQLWETVLDAPAFTTPVIADGKLVVAQQAKGEPVTLTVINPDDGQNVWRYTPNE